MEVQDTNMLNASLRSAYTPATEPIGTSLGAPKAAVPVEVTSVSVTTTHVATSVAVAPTVPAAEPEKLRPAVLRKKRRMSGRPQAGAALSSHFGGSGDGDEGVPPPSSGSSQFEVSRPTARYQDVGGIEAVLQDVRELIEWPLTHPELYVHLGVEPVRYERVFGMNFANTVAVVEFCCTAPLAAARRSLPMPLQAYALPFFL